MKKHVVLLLLTCFAAHLSAQVLFTASADRYKVGVGETFTVTFKINANAGDFKFPNFENFTVVAGPMTGVSSSYINGVSSVEKSASFDLIALKMGEFTIGSASVKADGAVHTTKPLTITVSEAGKNKSGSLEEKAAELASVKILTNKRKVYVGEPISTRYTILFKTQIENFDYLAEPEFQGFLKNDIEIKRIEVKQESINGETINSADIAKFVLIPQQAGTFSPGNLQLRLPTAVPTGRRDWFNRPEMRLVNQISTSAFPKLEVLPLPTVNKPASFSGAVGTYKLAVNLSRTEVKGNESVTLTIELSGKGNIQLVELPVPEIPNSIESYDPKYKENVDVLPTGIKGFKRNEILLIPRYKGVYKIPPMRFSYFDTDREIYVELSSEELTINVTEGEEAKNIPGGSPTSTDKNAVSAIGEDILFIHTKPSLFVKKTESFFTTSLHWLIVITLFVATFLLFVVQRIRQSYNPDLAAKARKKAGSNAKKQLKAAYAKLQANEIKAFYSELSMALQRYFQHKSKLAPADFNIEQVTQIILKKGADEKLAGHLKHLMTQANMARFAPLTEANMKADYELALQSLEKLEGLL